MTTDLTLRRLAMPALALACCLALPATAAAKPRDRDHDRLPDSWERHYHISTKHRSAKADPDHDRLTNLREYRAHTNPRRKDTDRDRLSDYAEVKRYKTNPRRKDTDRDGLSDYAEVKRYKTNPRRKDTDGDGVTDGAEVRAGTDPRKAPSSSPAATPPPVAGTSAFACTGAPNTPDGPDPWGGCFPGPNSTGVPPGTNLTPYTGPCRITVPNTVIDAKTVNCGYLEIYAQNVVIKNSLVNGSVWTDDPNQGGSFTITDSTVDAGPVDGDANDGVSAIGKSHFTALRVETIRGIRGVWCEYDCTVQDSYIHGQDKDEGGAAHESGIRMGSGQPGAGQHIVHTSLACDAPDVPPDAGCSADLTGYGDFAPIQNNLIERDLFLASTGGTCAYGGSSSPKPYPNGNNNVFRDNIFQHGVGDHGEPGHCGYWYAIADLDAGQRGNQWVNNRWDTGEPVPAG